MDHVSEHNIEASHVSAFGSAELQIGHRFISYYYGDGSQLPPDQLQKLREDAILSSLEFPKMNLREESVEDS